MTVDGCYRICQFLASKAQAGYITPTQFNLAINQGSNSYLDFLLGEIKERGTTVELWKNRKMRNSLKPFIAPPSTLTVDNTGLAPFPTLYILVDAMWTTDMDRIRFVQQNSLYSYLKSVIDPIATNPVYTIESDGFKFYPNDIGSAKISFVRQPGNITWGFTPDGNGRPVFNPATSTDPEWANNDILNVIVRGLRMIGVNLQSNILNQYASEIEAAGQ